MQIWILGDHLMRILEYPAPHRWIYKKKSLQYVIKRMPSREKRLKNISNSYLSNRYEYEKEYLWGFGPID